MPRSPRKYIDAGWRRFAEIAMPPTAGPVQVDETRQAFFAGASLLFTAITRGMSAGRKARPDDMAMISDIEEEVAEFGRTLDERYLRSILDRARH